MTVRKTILFLIIFCTTIQTAFCSAFEYGYTSDGFKYVIHHHSESSYQHAWCSAHNGIEEFENSDKTRVDCLTDTHAIEFDFANKWAESIGQALHYSFMTGKRAKVIFLDYWQLENFAFHYIKIKDFYSVPAVFLNIRAGFTNAHTAP